MFGGIFGCHRRVGNKKNVLAGSRAPIDFKATKQRENANKFELFSLFAIAMWGHQNK